MAKKVDNIGSSTMMQNLIYGALVTVILGMSAWTLNSVKDLAVQFGKMDVSEQWLTNEVKGLTSTVQALDHAVAAWQPQQQRLPPQVSHR